MKLWRKILEHVCNKNSITLHGDIIQQACAEISDQTKAPLEGVLALLKEDKINDAIILLDRILNEDF